MEVINDSAKLIAQAIELLNGLNFKSKVDWQVDEQANLTAIELLKTALDKLVVEI